MRLAVKNKDEGTELFRGAVSDAQFRTAAARYQMSLKHCVKFFDLTPEQTAEVNAMKVTLYLNLASCNLKTNMADLALSNCDYALKIEPKNPKALFRRSMAHEAKKDWEKALEDIKAAQQLLEVEDKAITAAAKRIRQCQKDEKEKAKGVWGQALGGL
jgi:tetratricopeptide (TPR) repeat protein